MSVAASVPFFSPAGAAFGVDLAACLRQVVDSGWYVLGSQVRDFEAAFADYVGVSHTVGVANGTDALVLALRALGVGAGSRVAMVANAGYYGSAAAALLAVPARRGHHMQLLEQQVQQQCTSQSGRLLLQTLPGCASLLRTRTATTGLHKAHALLTAKASAMPCCWRLSAAASPPPPPAAGSGSSRASAAFSCGCSSGSR